MNKPLKNIKHELFCLAIVDGMSNKDAGIKAGYKPTNVTKVASRLLTNVDIKERIQYLSTSMSEAVQSDTIMSTKKRMERLSELAEKEPKIQNPVAAIAELNKMDGSYAPEKRAVIGNITVTVKYDD